MDIRITPVSAFIFTEDSPCVYVSVFKFPLFIKIPVTLN